MDRRVCRPRMTGPKLWKHSSGVSHWQPLAWVCVRPGFVTSSLSLRGPCSLPTGGQKGRHHTQENDTRRELRPKGRLYTSLVSATSPSISWCASFHATRPRSCLDPEKPNRIQWEPTPTSHWLQKCYYSLPSWMCDGSPGMVLSRTNPKKPPTNILVFSSTWRTWSSSLTPESRRQSVFLNICTWLHLCSRVPVLLHTPLPRTSSEY